MQTRLVLGAAILLVAFVACIDDPAFTLAPSGGPDAATTTTTPPSTDDGTVLVPATMLANRVDAGRCVPIPLLGITCDAGSSSVPVAAFHLDRHEVTGGDYAACVAAGKCTATKTTGGCTTGADLPVSCVTRAQAAAFCGWKGKRLVKAVEHVAAAAGSANRTYPWGDEAPSADRVNACGAECSKNKGMYSTADAWTTTAPVGSLPAGKTPEGVLDLAGNVAEWVDGDPASVRGGSYADTDPAAVAATAAVTTGPDTATPTIGFRCARDGS